MTNYLIAGEYVYQVNADNSFLFLGPIFAVVYYGSFTFIHYYQTTDFINTVISLSDDVTIGMVIDVKCEVIR